MTKIVVRLPEPRKEYSEDNQRQIKTLNEQKFVRPCGYKRDCRYANIHFNFNIAWIKLTSRSRIEARSHSEQNINYYITYLITLLHLRLN